MSHSIDVQINRHDAYPIHFGSGMWEEVRDYFSARFSNRILFIVIDARVRSLHGQRIERECRRYFKSCVFLEVPEGEQSKSVEHWNRLLDELLQNGVERSTPLLAIGGGVTGDLAGFTAASALRGIPLVHMPTSLLAMVDSAIGGKTGVNHSVGKNLIGAFYQPEAVFMDLEFLKTLERRQWIGGLAEMLKYAAIQLPEMFDDLEAAVKEGFEPSGHWLELIRQSAAIKVDIVQQDEREAGKRAYLNFGHTFGHALEKVAGYGNISHGEAVFTGMLAAVYYSGERGAAVDSALFAPFKWLYDIQLPAKIKIPDLIKAMRLDKKVKDETIRLVLLRSWGNPYIEPCDNESLLEDAWRAALNHITEFNA